MSIQSVYFFTFYEDRKMGVDVLMQLMANLDFEKDLAFNIFYIYSLLLCGRQAGLVPLFERRTKDNLPESAFSFS